MYTQKKPIDNTHIVRERDRRRFRELLAVLALGIPIGLFLLLFTWQNLEVIRLGREATRLQQRRKEVEDANKVLRLQLDRLTALDAVQNKATALGFASTDPRTIVIVTPADGASASAPAARDQVQSAAGAAGIVTTVDGPQTTSRTSPQIPAQSPDLATTKPDPGTATPDLGSRDASPSPPRPAALPETHR